MTPRIDLVIPTIGRPSLTTLLETLGREVARAHSPDGSRSFGPGRIIVVDDRAGRIADLVLPRQVGDVQVVRSHGRGPAAARNLGWRHTAAPWTCFLDDDVVPDHGWLEMLRRDLLAVGSEVAAIQGRVRVPLPEDRPPTDWERNVAGLEEAAWITADMAVRRDALVQVGGFDERFRRAYREDTDLALRLMDAGLRMELGRRTVSHPVRPSSWWAPVRAQRGNADDQLMTRLHGPDWRQRGTAPPGLLSEHLRTTTALLVAVALVRRHPRLACAAAVTWVRRWNAFRMLRTTRSDDLPTRLRLGLTSAAIPVAATAWAGIGRLRAARLAPGGRSDRRRPEIPRLVLFDRDGTLVVDVPYNGDPAAVIPVPGAHDALERLRRAGVRVALVSNQSGVAKGLIDTGQVAAVNRRVEELLGRFDTVQFCPHAPDDACDRRKPAPGMIVDAARDVGVDLERCALIGDIGSDVEAGLAVGVRPILVPNVMTSPDEIHDAPEVALDLATAVSALLDRRACSRVDGRAR